MSIAARSQSHAAHVQTQLKLTTAAASKGPALPANSFVTCDAQGAKKSRLSAGLRHTSKHKSQASRRQVKPQSNTAALAGSMTDTEAGVIFINKAGQKLAGILNDTGSKEVVILTHGLGDHKNGFHLPALAKAFAVKDLSSLRFDYRGNKDSQGTFKYANNYEEADDVDAAVQYLKGLGKQPVGLLGHSKGGSTVLIYSALYGELPRVVNVAGRFDHKRDIKERFGEDVFERMERDGSIPQTMKVDGNKIDWTLHQKDLNDKMTLDMADVCSRIPDSVEVLTIHGTADTRIPVEDAHSFAEQLKGSRLVTIIDADHKFTQKDHAQTMIAQAVAFVSGGKSCLSSPVDHQASAR